MERYDYFDLIGKLLTSKIEEHGKEFFNKKVIEINYTNIMNIDPNLINFILANEDLFAIDFKDIFNAHRERYYVEEKPNFLASPNHSTDKFVPSNVELMFYNHPSHGKLIQSQLNIPSDISSKNLGNVLTLHLEIVSKSEIKPQIVTAHFECQSCGHRQNCTQETWGGNTLTRPKECFEIDGGCGRNKNQTHFLLCREESRIVDYIVCDTRFPSVTEDDYNYRKLLVTNSQYFDKLITGCTYTMKCIVDIIIGTKHQYSLHLSQLIESNDENSTLQTGKRSTARNRERTILEIVRRIHVETGQVVSLKDVLKEAGRSDITRDAAEDLVDALCRDGRLMRPGGYETLQPV